MYLGKYENIYAFINFFPTTLMRSISHLWKRFPKFWSSKEVQQPYQQLARILKGNAIVFPTCITDTICQCQCCKAVFFGGGLSVSGLPNLNYEEFYNVSNIKSFFEEDGIRCILFVWSLIHLFSILNWTFVNVSIPAWFFVFPFSLFSVLNKFGSSIF